MFKIEIRLIRDNSNLSCIIDSVKKIKETKQFFIFITNTSKYYHKKDLIQTLTIKKEKNNI